MTGEQKNKKTKRISVVLYTFYLLLLGVSVLIILRLAWIQLFYNPDPKIENALTPSNTLNLIEPARGNIIDSEGRLLAISCPSYQFYMDCTVRKDVNTEEEETKWLKKAAQLSQGLADEFGDRTADQYLKLIKDSRANGKKYVKIGHPVDRNGYNRIIKLPLFNEGRYYSGMQFEQENVREYPYGKLARRTIGFVRNNKSNVKNTHIGLEGKYDYILHGKEGREWLRVSDYGRVRNNDSTFTKAEDGKDLRTTINIDYQEIADKALRSGIEPQDDVEGGCLVLMEVKTGAIRAMVNLIRDQKSGLFEEIQNMAIGRKAEPGSVFKTVTLMSVLEDGYIKSLDETLPTNHGVVPDGGIKPDHHIVDWERNHKTNRISVIDGFKISSNYVFGRLAVENYSRKPERFVENIYSYKLGEAFNFDLEGMETPTIPDPKNKAIWSKSTLATMGYGYATGETPMHILTFYNAIANKGRMMKPYLVESIEEHGMVVERKGPSVLNASICKRSVADTLTRALRAVTEEGTARRLKDAKSSVAGKTGTSFATFENGKYADAAGRRKYQGTFVGFFPSEDPQYSIICTIYSKPTHTSFQGGGIPAIAVKAVVDRLSVIDPYWRKGIEK